MLIHKMNRQQLIDNIEQLQSDKIIIHDLYIIMCNCLGIKNNTTRQAINILLLNSKNQSDVFITDFTNVVCMWICYLEAKQSNKSSPDYHDMVVDFKNKAIELWNNCIEKYNL